MQYHGVMKTFVTCFNETSSNECSIYNRMHTFSYKIYCYLIGKLFKYLTLNLLQGYHFFFLLLSKALCCKHIKGFMIFFLFTDIPRPIPLVINQTHMHLQATVRILQQVQEWAFLRNPVILITTNQILVKCNLVLH